MNRDVWPAAVLLSAGLLSLIHLWRSSTGTAVFGVSPSTLPELLAALTAVMSLLLLITAVRAGPGDTAAETRRPDYRRPLGFLALSLAFVVALPWFGFVLGAGLFVAGLAWLFGNRRPLVILAMAVAAPVVLELFFEKFMLILLPSSRLLG